MFVDVLDRKEAFKDKKNRSSWKTQNYNFSKGVGPSFSSKVSDFFNFVFMRNKQKKWFRNVLVKKQASLDNRNVVFKKGNLDIFQRR